MRLANGCSSFPLSLATFTQFCPGALSSPWHLARRTPGRTPPPGAHSRCPGLSPQALPILLRSVADWELGFLTRGLPYLGQEELEPLPLSPPPPTASPIFNLIFHLKSTEEQEPRAPANKIFLNNSPTSAEGGDLKNLLVFSVKI